MTKLYRAGLYCRLSVDDTHNSAKATNLIPADESVSIEHQRELLSRFAMLNGWIETKTYLDDGFSGGNFQRPGFLEMLEDARRGLINLILVKDLSRLGRDYVEVGRYTDEVFPSLGCRFVSVLDGLDSDGDNTEMLHFRSLMNDYHLRDLSQKVKTVLQSKMLRGQHLARAPYGYRKSAEDKYRLVIDEEAAEVVRHIYEMRLAGLSYQKIVGVLNQNGIPAPRYYANARMGKDNSGISRFWLERSVKRILHSEVYVGNLVMNCIGRRSYKDKTMIPKPESAWIRHEATHAPIIEQKIWDTVQTVNRAAQQRYNGRKPPSEHLFSGKLICGNCHGPMLANTSVKKPGPTGQSRYRTEKRYVSYRCGRYTTSGHILCSAHSISENALKQLICSEIQTRSDAIRESEAAMLKSLKSAVESRQKQSQAGTRQEIAVLQLRIRELTDGTAELYEARFSGTIGDDAFQERMQKQERERMEKQAQLDTLVSELDTASRQATDTERWKRLIHKYAQLQDLDREAVDELIDFIEIDKTKTVRGKRIRNIIVHYRFAGRLPETK
ncbi:MAG: recombinase family protein [Oscillospiraceae bacterium]|nr:recombinase family protein [Oscillospiraceae bacterium]